MGSKCFKTKIKKSRHSINQKLIRVINTPSGELSKKEKANDKISEMYLINESFKYQYMSDK